jgi:hypothetical protein
MNADDDDQLKLARKMTAALAEDLELERKTLAHALGREPTRAEMAEHARRRFRADPAFRAVVMAANAQGEAEATQEWRERARADGH